MVKKKEEWGSWGEKTPKVPLSFITTRPNGVILEQKDPLKKGQTQVGRK